MANIELAKKLNVAAWVASVAVVGLVAVMRQITFLQGTVDLSFLPMVYSITNALVAVFLIAGLQKIRKKDIEGHKRNVTTALVLSALFLLMYVAYHLTSGEKTYTGVGFVRIVYFFLLITHVALAAISFPFILFTYIRGFTMQIDKHKPMARWVFWVWLYVSITGPIVYLMLNFAS